MALTFKTSLDDSGFAAGLRRMESGASQFAARLSTGAMLAAGKALVDYVSNIKDAADNVGLTAEKFQELAFVFAQSGVSQEKFQSGLTILSTKMEEARGGSVKMIESFEDIGISWKELNTVGADRILLDVAQAAKDADSPAKALAISVEFLGKSGKQMAAGLKEGREEMERLAKAAPKVSNEAVEQIDRFGDSFTALGKTGVGFLAGLINTGSDYLADAAIVVSDFITGNETARESVANLHAEMAKPAAKSLAKAIAPDPRDLKAFEMWQERELSRVQQILDAEQKRNEMWQEREVARVTEVQQEERITEEKRKQLKLQNMQSALEEGSRQYDAEINNRVSALLAGPDARRQKLRDDRDIARAQRQEARMRAGGANAIPGFDKGINALNAMNISAESIKALTDAIELLIVKE